MGISGTLGAVAAGGSLLSGLGGLFGHSGAQAPPQFQMPAQGQAATNAFQGIGALGGYNQYWPNINQAQGITQNLVNNPGAGQYLSGAQTAGGLGQLQALGQYGAGQQVQGYGQQLAPYAGAVMNTAFDPQQALYNQTLAQTLQQQQAQQAAAGIGTTPYGAGLTNQALQNFNIGWQQQQLQNQLAGLSSASGALGQAGNLVGAGQQLQAAAPGQYLTSAGLPYNVYGNIGAGQFSALNQLGQFGQSASQLPQQQIADYLQYVGAGNAANQTANQTVGLQAQLQNMYQNQIGAGLSGLGNVNWGNIFGSGGFGGTSGGKA